MLLRSYTSDLSESLQCRQRVYRMSDNLADDSKDVLEKVKADGTFDEMRLRVTEAVKKSVGSALDRSRTLDSLAARPCQ